MADVIATLFRFRQFVFEYGPFFLAAWLGLAIVTGLITTARQRWADSEIFSNPRLNSKTWRWIWRVPFLMLWHPGGQVPAAATFNRTLLFSLIASVPALGVTSLIGLEIVGLRLLLAALFTILVGWFVRRVVSRQRGEFRGQTTTTEGTPTNPRALNDESLRAPSEKPPSVARIVWESFTAQAARLTIPLIIGFSLASVLTVYVPAYLVRPWLGEGASMGPFLAALLALPLQLTGGAEVLLASALLVKGASLGTALSVMLAAPGAAYATLRHLGQPEKNIKALALYLTAVWFVAGSLGAVVDGVQKLIAK